MKHKRKKTFILLGSIALLLVLVHLLLPIFLKKYINKVLSEMPEYTGSVQKVGVNLFRGAYTLYDLVIVKRDSELPEPFVSLPESDISIEWKELFNGSIVGEIEFYTPTVNFIGKTTANGGETQLGEEVDWTEPLKEIMAFRINRIAIYDGTMHYLEYGSKPVIDLYLNNIAAELKNISNSEDKDKPLPSPFKGTATSIGNGKMDITANLNVLKQTPDFDFSMNYEGADVTAFNDFTKTYAKIDLERGTMAIYSEMAAKDGNLTGYVKPIVDDIDVVDFSEDIKNPIGLLWEGIAGIFIEVFENQGKDQFASKVPLEGKLEEPGVAVLPSVFNVFKNAFFGAFKKSTDNSVDFQDAGGNGNEEEDEEKEYDEDDSRAKKIIKKIF